MCTVVLLFGYYFLLVFYFGRQYIHIYVCAHLLIIGQKLGVQHKFIIILYRRYIGCFCAIGSVKRERNRESEWEKNAAK